MLKWPAVQALAAEFGHTPLVDTLRDAAALMRAGELAASQPDAAAFCRLQLETLFAPSQRRVLNLTGTVLHTNLGPRADRGRGHRRRRAGHAPPHHAGIRHSAAGQRGERDRHVEPWLMALTGAEAACGVNNNAAAVLLTLAALAAGREVIVSRGELVEIGGSFRIPDIMREAGCRLVEVGTTNRTHLADYERAIGPDTALIMKVHTSNYAVKGFTASVGAGELVSLAQANAAFPSSKTSAPARSSTCAPSACPTSRRRARPSRPAWIS